MNEMLLQAVAKINWIWMVVSILAAFGVGAVWYSLIFFKMWKRVFNVPKAAQDAVPLMRSLAIQFVSGIFLSLLYFMLVAISVKLAWLAVAAFASLQICNLAFKYGDAKMLFQSILIEAGYTVVGGTIYILFALI